MSMDEIDKLQYSHRTFSIVTESKKEKYMQQVNKRGDREPRERVEYELSVYDGSLNVCVHTETVPTIEKATERFRTLKSEFIFDYDKKLAASREY